MKLGFQSADGSERVIAEVDTYCEACKEINKFLDEHNFKSYYQRLWEKDDRVYMDVGSHYEFFFLEPCTMRTIYEEQEMLKD